MNQEGKQKTVAELANHVGGRFNGDGSTLIRAVASLESAGDDEIAFLEDLKLLADAARSRAGCLIVPPNARADSACSIEVENPRLAFALIAELLHSKTRLEPSVHPTAIIALSAIVDESVYVGPRVSVGERASIGAGTQLHAGAVIGDGVSIGPDCIIYPNVVIYEGVTIGARVRLHAGTIVGADGFGYVPDKNNLRHKFPQIGTVLIEDDVEIGANTCIDRGALGKTRIGRATKIDNLVQIAHNVDIGERVVIAAQTGISGSTVIEDDAIIGGQVGMGDHARVQSGAIIGSKAGILPGKIVRPGVWWGIPVQPLDQYKRLNAHLNRLPQMREEIKELRRQVRELMERDRKKD
ncbi:MAG: UDP-3-O-[3-hydroxymyristoyl] glucosamine N-acyltransferase [Blastocatellia bacterium]|jgi:UDP-3-O-[3-hydroxymyristoyl] glucosamine N-acyltransferase|nr:UDP-3-O-[3-hydroxymyristoyl] glucosamine N-acyltransferase [Blastocatellia bacterium]